MVSMVRYAEEATAEPCPEARAAPRERAVTLAGLSLVLQWCAATACSCRSASCGKFEEAWGPIGTMASSTRHLLHSTDEGRGTLKRR